jgi:hypothetical protein
MDNILPKFKSFSIDSPGNGRYSQWKPTQAIAETKIVLPKREKQVIIEDSKALDAPNDRYKKDLSSFGKSPLSVEER